MAFSTFYLGFKKSLLQWYRSATPQQWLYKLLQLFSLHHARNIDVVHNEALGLPISCQFTSARYAGISWNEMSLHEPSEEASLDFNSTRYRLLGRHVALAEFPKPVLPAAPSPSQAVSNHSSPVTAPCPNRKNSTKASEDMAKKLFTKAFGPRAFDITLFNSPLVLAESSTRFVSSFSPI